MASTQEFRRRIKSVNNTKQITKAMEMVASVKMQKAVKTILEARDYVQNSWDILKRLASLTLPEDHPLLKPEVINKTAIIFVTSDRGLCGAYNADVLKKLTSFIKNESDPSLQTKNYQLPTSNDIIAIGKKGADFVRNYGLGNLIAIYDGFENEISYEDVIPISVMSSDEYLKGKYDRIVIIYSHFISSLRQTPTLKQILPISLNPADIPSNESNNNVLPPNTIEDQEYIFEPSADKILEKLLYRSIHLQIYGAVLEANASEHSARMVGMKNATDNAEELISELTLTYNTIRQNSITNEIAEICAGAESMR